jgi:hypothetical protein
MYKQVLYSTEFVPYAVTVTLHADGIGNRNIFKRLVSKALGATLADLEGLPYDESFDERFAEESCIRILNGCESRSGFSNISVFKVTVEMAPNEPGADAPGFGYTLTREELRESSNIPDMVMTAEGLTALNELNAEDDWDPRPSGSAETSSKPVEYMQIIVGDYKGTVIVVTEDDDKNEFVNGNTIAKFGDLSDGQEVSISRNVLRTVTEDEALAAIEEYGSLPSNDHSLPLYLNTPTGHILVDSLMGSDGEELQDEARMIRQTQIYGAKTEAEHKLDKQLEAHIMLQAALGGGGLGPADA